MSRDVDAEYEYIYQSTTAYTIGLVSTDESVHGSDIALTEAGI